MFSIPQQQVESSAFGVVAFVVPKRKFIHIPLQVLFRGEVIDTDDTAFQYRPKALNRVGINIPTNILTRAMIHVVVFK